MRWLVPRRSVPVPGASSLDLPARRRAASSSALIYSPSTIAFHRRRPTIPIASPASPPPPSPRPPPAPCARPPPSRADRRCDALAAVAANHPPVTTGVAKSPVATGRRAEHDVGEPAARALRRRDALFCERGAGSSLEKSWPRRRRDSFGCRLVTGSDGATSRRRVSRRAGRAGLDRAWRV